MTVQHEDVGYRVVIVRENGANAGTHIVVGGDAICVAVHSVVACLVVVCRVVVLLFENVLVIVVVFDDSSSDAFTFALAKLVVGIAASGIYRIVLVREFDAVRVVLGDACVDRVVGFLAADTRRETARRWAGTGVALGLCRDADARLYCGGLLTLTVIVLKMAVSMLTLAVGRGAWSVALLALAVGVRAVELVVTVAL